MLTCPNCETRLVRVKSPHGVFWGCTQCRGRAVTLPVLRKQLEAAFLNGLWRVAGDAARRGTRACPSCAKGMAAVQPDGGNYTLDVCRPCHLVWFDPREFEAAPEIDLAAAETPDRELPMKARELVARVNLQRVTEAAERAAPDRPEEGWKYAVALLGVPVETAEQRPQRLPLVTWGLTGLMMLVMVLTVADLRNVVDAYGLIPEQAGRLNGLTFLTSFFLHGGAVHLLGNVYFLVVFGDNVEDSLGALPYAALIALAAVAGNLVHIAFDPRSALPLIGASGGISGIVAFYALAFPRARLGFFFWVFFIPRWISLPAIGFVALWVVFQLVGVFLQLGGFSSVSALAHLGGAAIGVGFWFLYGR